MVRTAFISCYRLIMYNCDLRFCYVKARAGELATATATVHIQQQWRPTTLHSRHGAQLPAQKQIQSANMLRDRLLKKTHG